MTSPSCSQYINDTSVVPSGVRTYVYTCDRHRHIKTPLDYELGETTKGGLPLSRLDLHFTVRAQDNVTVRHVLLRVQRMSDDADLRPRTGLTVVARAHLLLLRAW